MPPYVECRVNNSETTFKSMTLKLAIIFLDVVLVHEGELISNNNVISLESLGDFNATRLL